MHAEFVSSSPTKILIVEDNDLEAGVLRDAFRLETKWRTELAVVEDGEDAIEYLGSAMSAPDLMILDLNLPHRRAGSASDGKEFASLRALAGNSVQLGAGRCVTVENTPV
jgi:CheY-like chemotaxis protein